MSDWPKNEYNRFKISNNKRSKMCHREICGEGQNHAISDNGQLPVDREPKHPAWWLSSLAKNTRTNKVRSLVNFGELICNPMVGLQAFRRNPTRAFELDKLKFPTEFRNMWIHHNRFAYSAQIDRYWLAYRSLAPPSGSQYNICFWRVKGACFAASSKKSSCWPGSKC